VYNMIRLSNKDFKDNILTNILELSSTDLKFVTKDGAYNTQKLLIWSAFPALHSCLLDCYECCEEVTVILPEEYVDNVQEGIVKMLLEGDISYLNSVLGIKSSIDLNHNKKNKFSKTKKSVLESLHKENADESEKGKDIAEDICEDPLEQEVCVKEEIYLDDDEYEEYVPPPKKKLKKDPNIACSECGKKFRDNYNLKRHMERGHNTVLKCERCEEEFPGRGDFTVHLKTCWIRCEMCDWVTQRLKEKINGHKRRHAKEGETCTFVRQKLEKEEVEALRKQSEDKWKNKERQYTERITYVYK